MDRKTMMTLVGGIVALMILVVAVDSLMGGLPGTVRTLYEQETSELEAAGARLSQDRKKVEALVSRESDFLKAIEVREVWWPATAPSDPAIDRLRARAEAQGVHWRPLAARARPIRLGAMTMRAERWQELEARPRRGCCCAGG